MKIKILNIEIFYIKYPIKKKLKYPLAHYVSTGFIFFKVKTNLDVYGFGEPSPYGSNIEVMIKIFKKYFLPTVKNKEIDLINIQFLSKFSFFKKNEPVLRAIFAGIDQAFWDIKAKIKKKPLYRLLNNKVYKNNSIKLYASGGMIFDNQDYNILIDEALKQKDIGFYGYKFRPSISKKNQSHFQRNNNPPNFDIKKFLIFFKNLRKSLGDEFKLMVDFGCRIKSFKDFNYISDCVSELNFFFIEEPMKRELELYKKIKKNSKVNIATGETISSIQQFNKWKLACNIIQPDTNLISISELMEIKKKFKFDSKKTIFHNWANPISMLSNFHTSKALGGELIEYNITYNPFSTIIMNNRMQINKGLFKYGSKSGLGIDLNEKTINKYLIQI